MDINIKLTKNLKFLMDCDSKGKQFIILQGGTRSGKTYAVLTFFLLKALAEKNKIFSILAINTPHLKRGAMRDFENLIKSLNITNYNFNKTDKLYTFSNGSKIEFIAVDKADKLRGAQRDYIFFNEANLIPYETFQQAIFRTKGKVVIDYNPSAKFWLHEFLKSIPQKDWDAIITTYRDNPYLSKEQIKKIELFKNDPYTWAIYGLGKFSKAPDLIIRTIQLGNYLQIGTEVVGLDFGITDPTAIVIANKDRDVIYVKEIFKGITQSINDIIKLLNPYKDKIIIADTNELRTIHELRLRGFNVIKTHKYAGSVEDGVRLLNQHKIVISRGSKKLWKELTNYRYNNLENKKLSNYKYEDHLIDAMRYAAVYLIKNYNKPLIY